MDLGAEFDRERRGERDPQTHQFKKGIQWYFGIKAHIGVDAGTGLVHTVVDTAANISDINIAGSLLHGEEHAAFRESGYQGVHKRAKAVGPTWHAAMRAGKRKALNPFKFVAKRVEKKKASFRAKVEQPFSSDQTAIPLQHGSLSTPGEEHGADLYAVCTVELVDGAAAVDAGEA